MKTTHMQMWWVVGTAWLGLACPNGGETVLDTTGGTSSTGDGPGTTTVATPTSTGDAPTSTTGEPVETSSSSGDTGVPPEGLVVHVTPAKPRSGSTAQLSATLDGAPVEVDWKLLSGPGKPGLTAEGAFGVPRTKGTWKVQASVSGDPQVTASATIVADFRGGLPISGWASGGRWLYDGSSEDDRTGDLVASADTLYATIWRTDQKNATVLAALDEATGKLRPGFGTNGLREFTIAGKPMDPYSLALGPDRLYIGGRQYPDWAVAPAAPTAVRFRASRRPPCPRRHSPRRSCRHRSSRACPEREEPSGGEKRASGSAWSLSRAFRGA